jgi:hypothetical protein
MRRAVAALSGTVLLVSGGAGVAAASAPTRLAAVGPTSVSGTEATSVFEFGERTIRQVRYHDRGALADEGGDGTFEVGAGETVTVTLRIRMENCESLSARAGSFATEVALATSRIGFVDEEVLLTLPEQLHTGSPREASCPRATATSRPPG